jgi:hypothetical protein
MTCRSIHERLPVNQVGVSEVTATALMGDIQLAYGPMAGNPDIVRYRSQSAGSVRIARHTTAIDSQGPG